MADTKTFLGRGFAFPPRVDEATGRFVMCADEENIRQSVYTILMTRRGERVMMPDFGCNLNDYVFELPDATAISMVRNEVLRALAKWESRIIDVDVGVVTDELSKGVLTFEISYVVRNTNNPNNLVFPYYLYEGIGLE